MSLYTYIIQYVSFQVGLQFLENKVCERPNNVWCIESNCLLSACPRCSGEKYGYFQMQKIWKTGWHSCCVRSQFWDVRTQSSGWSWASRWAWPAVMLFCSLLTFIPLVWPSLSPFEHSLHLPAAAGVAELRMQALSPLLPPSLLLPGLPGAAPSSRAEDGVGDGDGCGVKVASSPSGLAGSWGVPKVSRSVSLGFSLVRSEKSRAAALQGKPGNATNTTLSDSVIAFVGCFFPARELVCCRERVKQ